MSGIDILGFCAAFCTTISFLPQAIKVIRSRDTSSLSLAMYSIFTIGVSLWLAYGLYKQDLAMIIANIITLVLATIILATKIVNDVMVKRNNPAQ
ncbi:SemiSWEET transporter [Saccharophagus degradans]|uniref:MtN3 and saliva related transmembrane protein n=2 Tax=Saccharophagus degradans TaxID=86304 RepID=Q21EM2_SACD2|nr:SemiSWEET transporter [Saccharophagus degradans]ABD82857.1 MtN3 and saliva related transmembrane protein [Saccharophagus degradans 2-40]MBU2986104.1 SemiSWEET transporter [Saccharophagus degradans]MDO6423589.1 SemiSWEET transporter [Saccharophagus degradans]MDO6607739.1 SemiSWEET transporter [Saccharophagus degradans]WGO98956.1 SemiSWEET transporter [Saccharophagus degradans]